MTQLLIETCRGRIIGTGCEAPLENNGIEGSGFCEECWSEQNVEGYQRFRAYRAEGYSIHQALVMAGFRDPNSD